MGPRETPAGFSKVLLLTGGPGTGKTTIIKAAAALLGSRAGGFYTEEIKKSGVRQGFRIVTLDGHEGVLAHVSYRGPARVGKYGVDMEALDRTGVAALRRAVERRLVLVVDEIGKMELMSSSFRETVEQALVSGLPLLGTIMLARHPWTDIVKTRPDVRLIEIAWETRDKTRGAVLDWVREIPLRGEI